MLNNRGQLTIFACGIALFFSGCSESQSQKKESYLDEATTTSIDAASAFLREDVNYVGVDTCKQCHSQEFEDWQNSHHDQAMKVADATTVLGDFTHNNRFEHAGVQSVFNLKDNKYWVTITEPNSTPQTHEILYTFGVEPLQQYLVQTDGGKLQALTICWDSRPKEEGGQRWYHLYPDIHQAQDPMLHWQGAFFNWNRQCADCHSTGLKRDYNDSLKEYHTTFTEINVSCEACHGAGAEHVNWAKSVGNQNYSKDEFKNLTAKDMGLNVDFSANEKGFWTVDPETKKPKRSEPLVNYAETQTCAACHSRRGALEDTGDMTSNDKSGYHDKFELSLLQEGLYHDDGQILDEVYVYGSFIQSKMHHKGVRCTDCHNPHSNQLKLPVTQVCFQCHAPNEYNTPKHHQHASEVNCVDCHMPERHYMVVDGRRDHSFRIPRPDLTVKYQTPNACQTCHNQESDHALSDEQLSEKFHDWTGGKYKGENLLNLIQQKDRKLHFSELLAPAKTNPEQSPQALIALIQDTSQPAIARATALNNWGGLVQAALDIRVLQPCLDDESPLVRAAAIGSLNAVNSSQVIKFAVEGLEDKVKIVRLAATRFLRQVPRQQMTSTEWRKFLVGLDEFKALQAIHLDKAAGHLTLAYSAEQAGQLDQAEQHYLRAIELEPYNFIAYLNFAEFHYTKGDLIQNLTYLEKALEVAELEDTSYGVAADAMGRYHIRNKDYTQAMPWLQLAAQKQPNNANAQYFYGVALDSQATWKQAEEYLLKAIELAPYNQTYRQGYQALKQQQEQKNTP